MFRSTGKRPRRFWPFHSWCRFWLAIWCSTLLFCIFSFWSIKSFVLLLCSRQLRPWPKRSSSGSRRRFGSSSWLSLNTRGHRRIVSGGKNMTPCTVCLELCRIRWHLRPRFGKVAGRISSVPSSLFCGHIVAKLLPWLCILLDWSGWDPWLNWKLLLCFRFSNNKWPCSTWFQGRVQSTEARFA